MLKKNVRMKVVKKLFFILIFILMLCGALLLFMHVQIPTQKPFSEVTTQTNVTIPERKESEYKTTITPAESKTDTGQKFVWITVNDADKIILQSNLDEKLGSKELATKNNCESFVGGGFYTQENEHIGLFITEGETISEVQDSETFNGYFSISKDGIVSITEYPVFSPRISLQSGPLLIINGEKVDLSIANDENARRIVVGVTNTNRAIFLTIYDRSNSFSGPKLSELPELVERINKDKNLSILYALNLDGGTHSAFISDVVTLSEASTVGSFFCIKP